jgi:hypothetical protein
MEPSAPQGAYAKSKSGVDINVPDIHTHDKRRAVGDDQH